MPRPNPICDIQLAAEFERKVVHILTILVPIVMLRMTPSGAMALPGAIAALALATDIVRAKNPRFERLIRRWFGRLLREDEKASAGIRINGATWLFVGGFLAVVLFGVKPGALGLATFIAGDAAAGLIGRRFGRRPWVGTKATLSGSAAFFVAAATAGLLLPGPGAATCMVAALISAVAEAVAPVNDNLVVPVVAAALFHLL